MSLENEIRQVADERTAALWQAALEEGKRFVDEGLGALLNAMHEGLLAGVGVLARRVEALEAADLTGNDH